MHLAASSCIGITEIDLGSARFTINNVFIVLLNDMQYKLAFTRHIDMHNFKTNTYYWFVIY